jgi:hypothetical protein
MTNTLRLNEQQVQRYRREGFIIYPEEVLPPAKFAGLKEHFEELLAALPAEKRPETMDVPHFTSPRLFDWLFADEVLDLVEPITGPDIALFSSHFICKPSGDGKRVPWHEDSSYWRDMVVPMEVVTVWLAIDPSTEVNGCMKVIPRSHHKGGYSEYEDVDKKFNVFPTEIKRHQFDEQSAVSCVLQPNHASLHDGRLMHGSEPNRSNIRRCGYTMRYISTRCRFNSAKYPWHQVYLARGRDHAGNTYGDPTQTYHELMAARVNGGKKLH